MSDNQDVFRPGTLDHCVCCGVAYYLEEHVEKRHRKSGNTFHCPNGHQMAFTKPTPELEKLREENTKLKQDLESANTNLKNAEAKIAELTNELEIWKPNSKE